MESKSEDIMELFKEATNLLRSKPQSINDVKKLYQLKEELDEAFLSFLEYCLRYDEEGSNKKDVKQIYLRVNRESISSMLDKLSKKGRNLREKLGEDFRKMGYRILEQIRTGKRSDVEYSIVRIFITNGENIPSELIEAFKPKYDDETFKAFMYAFIGSVIKPKESNESVTKPKESNEEV